MTRRPQSRFGVGVRRALGFEGRLTGHGLHLKGRIAGSVGPDGRPASITFTTDGHGEPIASFALNVRMAPLIRLTRENFWTRFAKLLRFKKEIEVGDKAFDDLLLVEVASPVRAKESLARGADARRAIIEAFGLGVTKLVVGRPNLVATVPLPNLRRTRDYVTLLGVLETAAAALDRVHLNVSVLGGERFALAGVHGQPRCAYCHADVTGEESDLVACAKCGTVLHEPCWSELGRCALLGCTGAEVERARPPR